MGSLQERRTGLLLRKLNYVTRIQKPYSLSIYIQNMVIEIKFLSSNPEEANCIEAGTGIKAGVQE